MQTKKLGIEINQNTDFYLVIQLNGQDGPLDLTGYQLLGQVRDNTGPTSQLIAEFVFTILDQTMPETLGQVAWSLPVANDGESEITTSTAFALVKKRQQTPFVYDVKMKDTSGKVSRIVEGLVYVSPEATQEAFT